MIGSLKRIGNLLGKLLKIDTLTTTQNRGKFARLCVELDLTKPLEAFIQINQGALYFEREVCLRQPGADSSTTGLKVSEDFGFNNVDSGGMAIQGTTRKSYVSKNGASFEKKVWTKARQTNVGNRAVLSDISKQPGKSRASGLFGGKTNLGFSGFSKSSVSNKGMKVVDESRAFVFDSVNAYMDSWGKGQSLYQEKAVYIFGHQPPNIANNGDHHGKDCDPEDDEDYVASSLHDGLLFDEGMDISAGKVNDSNGNVGLALELPWILAGDFNDMLNYDDKLEGAPLCRLKGSESGLMMIDLGYSGPKFTWSNKKVLEELIEPFVMYSGKGFLLKLLLSIAENQI
ncbi:unnamed protein product [Prunus armeniaca]